MENDPLVTNPIWKGRDFIIDNKLCFIVMPFNFEWSDTVFSYVEQIVTKFNLNTRRADSVTGHIIMEDIWRLLNQARLVIVDVTENNPNVFYELGIAHTLGKNVILLAQNTDHIPFDISSYRHIIYKGDTSTYKILDEQLSNHIQNILEDSPTGNPIVDDIIKKMKFWKTQGYDYDQLLNAGKLRIIKRFVDVDILSEEVLAYCLISSIYYGIVDEILYWTKKNEDNKIAAEILGLYILMPYRRPKYRAAYIIQFLKKSSKNIALNIIAKESPNHKLIKHINNLSVVKFVEENKNKDQELILTNTKKLLTEFTEMEQKKSLYQI